MARLRDVLPQNPNRVRDPQAQHRVRKLDTETMSLKDGFTQRVVDTPIKHLVHTHPSSNRHQHDASGGLGWLTPAHRRVGTP
jgi:hypothetical protein